jgi:hypothetical protein
MAQEFEAKFLNINIIEMRKQLEKIGSKKEYSFVKFERAAFNLCDPNIKGFVRVRNEVNKVTMTSKIYKNENFPEENEISINESFDNGVNFLKSLSLPQRAFQESLREKWNHPLVHEIVFDILPGLPIYMEVDCTSENDLNKMIELLKLDNKLTRYGSFDKTYLEYYDIPKDVINNQTPFLTFNNISNEIKPTKNLNLFKKISEIQLKIDDFDKYIDEYSKIRNC